MTSLSKLALVASVSLALMSGTALAQQKVFNIWHFEQPDSSNGMAFGKALDEFKTTHPDVTVKGSNLAGWHVVGQADFPMPLARLALLKSLVVIGPAFVWPTIDLWKLKLKQDVLVIVVK